MKTQVTFRSNKFPPYEGEQEQINPGLWGRRLAEYLVVKLQEHGIEPGALVPEDWGWFIPMKNLSCQVALCCGHQDGDPDEFLIVTEPARPITRKLFRTIDASEPLSRLVTALQRILEADPDIRAVEWSEVTR